jgi:ABC-2 type transport system ATP-binding protein
MDTPALKIQQLNKTYSNGFQALHNIDLTVSRGDFFALLGANGAGKSTAIGIVSSLVNKTSGTVEILGFDLDAHPSQAKRQLGVVPQEFNFVGFETPLQIVMNQAAFFGVPHQKAKQSAERYLKQVDLWGKRHESSMRLSGGMKRRLMIARALMHQPQLLILDEPTAGVDIEIRQQMWHFLQKLNRDGVTIILTTHYLEVAEKLCNHIAIMQAGKIVTNTTMQSLLSELAHETVILYLEHPAQAVLPDWSSTQIDASTLEVVLTPDKSLTQLLDSLKQQAISVNRLRNKTNRLEQFFLEKTHDTT